MRRRKMNRRQPWCCQSQEECGDIWPTGDTATSLWKGLSPLSICCPIKLDKNNYPSKTVELSVTDCSPQTVRDKSEPPPPPSSVKILLGPPSQNFPIFICVKQWEINQLLFVPGSIIKIWPAAARCRVGKTFVFLRLMIPAPLADSRTRGLNANKAIVIHLKQRLLSSFGTSSIIRSIGRQ